MNRKRIILVFIFHGFDKDDTSSKNFPHLSIPCDTRNTYPLLRKSWYVGTNIIQYSIYFFNPIEEEIVMKKTYETNTNIKFINEYLSFIN